MSVSALRAALAAQGGTVSRTLAAAGTDGDDAEPDPAPALAAAGPRAAGREPDYELLLEMILEGSRLHYGAPQVVSGEDPDLALLLGDQLYALGLSRLAALGDLDAVSELADLISLVAQAQLRSDPQLAAAAWRAGAAAIGWGGRPELEHAKRQARAGDPGATAALDRAADAILSGNGRLGK